MVFHILFTHPSALTPHYPLKSAAGSGTAPASQSPSNLLPLSLFISILESFPATLDGENCVGLVVPHDVPLDTTTQSNMDSSALRQSTEQNQQDTSYSYWNTRHMSNSLIFPDPQDSYTHHFYHPIHSKASSLDNSTHSTHHKRVPYCSMKFHCMTEVAPSMVAGGKSSTNASQAVSGFFTIDISQTAARFLQNLTDAIHLSQVLAKRYGLTLYYHENNEWKKLTQVWLNEKFWNQLEKVHKVEWHRKRIVFVEKQLTPLEWALKAQIDLVSEFFRFKIDVEGILEDQMKRTPSDREILLWMRKHLRQCMASRELIVDYGSMRNGKRIENYEGFQMDTSESEEHSDDVDNTTQQDPDIPTKGSITLTNYIFHIKHRRSLIRRTQIEFKPSHRQLQLTPYHAAQLGKLNRYVEWTVLATSTLLAVKAFIRRTRADCARVKFNEVCLSEGLLQNIEKQVKGTGFEFYLWWKQVQEENAV